MKRFFCDDLTPVGFEDPQEHVAGAHGSDTSCFACHYKLDPMAGFFRGLGAQFYDYSRERTIIFDDLADDSRSRYEATWRTPQGLRPQVEHRLRALAALGEPEQLRRDAGRPVQDHPRRRPSPSAA